MATVAQRAVYRFEGFVLDIPRSILLTEDGEAIPLRYKSFELLRLFVENAGQLLDRDAIIQAVWSGAIVNDDSVTQCVRDIRRTLGDEAQTMVKTVPRRGYVFAAKITTSRDERADHNTANAAALPDKPSIAVLPFTNMSGDPEQEYFVDGMVEEIITALSRIRWLFVIARNSSFTYKGQAVDVKQVGRELGVRYVLEGSVRKAGQRVRITGQLIDADTGTHLWADRFDGSLEDVFELQDKVASSVAGVIEPALQAAETARSASRPTADLTAYDLYLRAYAMFWSSARQIARGAPSHWSRRSRATRVTGPRSPGPLTAVFGWFIDGRSEDPATRPSEGHRFRQASPGSGRRRSGHPGECRLRAGLFRRGHRRHDGIGRPCPGAQPELRPRLAHQRRPQAVGRPARHRDRACRDLAAPQSPRPHRPGALP